MRDEHSLAGLRGPNAVTDPLLTDVFDELRSWGEGPAPAPTAALASLLATDEPCTTAGPLAPAPPRRKKRMLVSELLAGLGTKLAALGLVAKAGLGVGVAAAAVTTAGAAGVLPDAAQHAVAVAVETVTPLQLPDPTGSTTTTTLGTTGTVGDDDADEDADDDSSGTTGQPANHGACVSAVAKDKSLTGREHGQAVSAIAQSDCGKESTTSSTTVTSSTTTSTTVAGLTANSNRGNSGNGGGNSGQGGGNSGNSGNSGSGGGNSGNGNGNSGRS